MITQKMSPNLKKNGTLTTESELVGRLYV